MNAKADRSIPEVIAHRGASRSQPENTLKAFAAAIDEGCDAIETDLQLSADEIPIVYHDRTLARAGLRGKRVSDLVASELARLRVRPPEGSRSRPQPIPTLDELLDRFGRSTRWLLEIKRRDDDARQRRLVEQVVRRLARRRLQRRVRLLCFDMAVLDHARSLDARVGLVLNVRPLPRLGAALRRRLDRLDALSADVRTLTPGFAAGLQRTTTPLLVFTCNTPGRVRRAVACGASGVMSDRPGWLRTRLDEER